MCPRSESIRHPLWERACSRKRPGVQHRCQLTRRHREQARSHIGSRMCPRSESIQHPPVGASLLAKAVGQSATMSTGMPPSLASSPTLDLGCDHDLNQSGIPLWERACSRKRWVNQPRCRQVRRHREQAHRGLGQTRLLRTARKNCGSKLSPCLSGRLLRDVASGLC